VDTHGPRSGHMLGAMSNRQMIRALALTVLLATGCDLVTPAQPRGPLPRPGESFENPGQPFWGLAIHCMTPPEAQIVIAGRGFGVEWQINDHRSGTGRGSALPPATGIIQGGWIAGRTAHVVVEVGQRAAVSPDCR
jgi:hypothetical protein